MGVVFTPIFQQILIIEGETGSGKTTQIPQYLYEAVSEISYNCVHNYETYDASSLLAARGSYPFYKEIV